MTRVSTTPSNWLIDTFYPSQSTPMYGCWLIGNDISRTPIINLGSRKTLTVAKAAATKELGSGYIHHGIALAVWDKSEGDWCMVSRKDYIGWYDLI